MVAEEEEMSVVVTKVGTEVLELLEPRGIEAFAGREEAFGRGRLGLEFVWEGGGARFI